MSSFETTTVPGIVEMGECELFGDFGVFIQVVLGVSSIGSLLCIPILAFISF